MQLQLTQEVQIENQTIINVTLEEDAAQLDEIVVIGYGNARKKDVTGASSSIKAKDLQAVQATTADDFLQGRVSGLLLTQTSGQPGAATSVRIRGSGSINASNEPLYVIDGFPVVNDRNSAGVAETNTVCGLISFHSSNFKGRLSRQEGNLKP
jgi:outer membrane receptor for Fe3+-dicitrate